MGQPERLRHVDAYRDGHDRRPRLLRPVLEFDEERLRRLQERMRDTQDP
jgi:hypothetical protein